MSKGPLIRLLIGSVCISFSPVFIRLADVDPDLAGFYRMLFAAAGLLPLYLLQNQKNHPVGKKRFFLLASGVFLGIDFMFWHRSINLIGPGLSTLLGNFQVFFTALFSWLIFKERISLNFVAAVLIAICGLGLVTGIDVPALEPGIRWGILFGFLTALFYSGYMLLMKQAMTGSSFTGVTAMLTVSIGCLLFLGGFNLLSGKSFVVADSSSLLALVAVGLISTALGWSLISTAIKQVPATLVGLVLLLQPTLAFVWDVLIFSRETSLVEYLGIALILTAIYLGTARTANPTRSVEDNR